MQIRKILRFYNKFIVPTVILVICAIGTVYGIIPAVRSIQEQYENQKLLSSEIVAIKNRAMILESLDEDTLRTDMTALMTALPANKSIQTVMTTLDAVSLQSGFNITEIKIDKAGNVATKSAATEVPTAPVHSTPRISISITGNGSLDQIQRFLSTIVSVRRLFRVNPVTISFGSNGIIDAEFQIDAFYAPFPKTLGKTTGQLTNFTANEEEILSKISSYPLISEELRRYESAPAIQFGDKSDPFLPL